MAATAAECFLYFDRDRYAVQDRVARELDRVGANSELQLTVPDVDRLARDRGIRDRRLGRDPHLDGSKSRCSGMPMCRSLTTRPDAWSGAIPIRLV